MRDRPIHRRLVVIATLSLIASSLTYGTAVRAAWTGPTTGLACAPRSAGTATDPTYNLTAMTGSIVTPDGNSIFMWSYGLNGVFQSPGPVLCVKQGSRVTIVLKNRLPVATSIVFPGQSGVEASGGTVGIVTREAPKNTGTVTYSFTASAPGTYLYESGTEPTKQVEMGLYGALIVRPAANDAWAYADSRTEFDPNREYLAILHEVDPALHAAVKAGTAYDVSARRSRYFFLNGRAFPDTISDNGVSRLPYQPYGALIKIRGLDKAAADAAKPALVRYLNAGWKSHPMHPHGNHFRVIARDGAMLEGGPTGPVSYEDYANSIAPGQTYDAFLRFTDVELWRPTANPVPVDLPGLNAVTYKDPNFYSGSPYLGFKGPLPGNVATSNQCGEYYFPLHSHALQEMTNYDQTFGGMATIIRVDAPDLVQSAVVTAARVDVTGGTSATDGVVAVPANQTYSDGTASLSVTGLPAGVTGIFYPANVRMDGGASRLTLTAGLFAPPVANQTIRIRATAGCSSAEVTAGVTVIAAPAATTATAGPEPGFGGTKPGWTIATISSIDGQVATATPSRITRGSYELRFALTTADFAVPPRSLGVTFTGWNSVLLPLALEIYNYTTLSWDPAGWANLGTATTTVTGQGPSLVSDYLSRGVNGGVAQVRVVVTNATSFYTYLDRLQVRYAN